MTQMQNPYQPSSSVSDESTGVGCLVSGTLIGGAGSTLLLFILYVIGLFEATQGRLSNAQFTPFYVLISGTAIMFPGAVINIGVSVSNWKRLSRFQQSLAFVPVLLIAAFWLVGSVSVVLFS